MCVYKLWQRSLRVRSVSFISGQWSSLFHCFPARKKSSQYTTVDTEHYSSIVKTVLSTRTSSQTPESIEYEDQCLYGCIVKSKPQQSKVLKNPWPLLNETKSIPKSHHQKENIIRISLQNGPGQVSVPSVTKILQKTMSEQQVFYLERWKRRKIDELGEEGFKQYTTNIFNQGRLFHSAIEGILAAENLLEEEEVSFAENVSGYLRSISHVLDVIREVKVIESFVQHQALQYRGIVDCVAKYKDSLCVIDWKTSERPKPFLENTYDNPLQVAAYIGALNSDNNYDFQVENGLIIVAYDDGSPAHCHFLNADKVTQYWKKWLFRLEKYKEKPVQPSLS